METVEITGVVDLMIGVADRHRLTHPKTAENAERRARFYAGVAIKKELNKRCAGTFCFRQIEEARFHGAGVEFCSRNCMESYYDRKTKK